MNYENSHTTDFLICQIVELGEGPEAVCSTVVDGYEIPRMSFPADILRQKSLSAGSCFIWNMRNAENVEITDVDIYQEENQTVDITKLEELYVEMKKGLDEDGGKWPEYTGPGR